MANVIYWVWIGSIYLAILTFKDFSNNMLVDDRHNYMMFGITLGVLFQLRKGFLGVLLLFLVVMALGWVLGKTKALGEADIKSIGWIWIGLGIQSYGYLIWWCIIFLGTMMLHYFFARILFKYKEKVPFYPVILISFVLNAMLNGMYFI